MGLQRAHGTVQSPARACGEGCRQHNLKAWDLPGRDPWLKLADRACTFERKGPSAFADDANPTANGRRAHPERLPS
jgi:hypothetical protein